MIRESRDPDEGILDPGLRVVRAGRRPARMTRHREERTYTITLRMSAEFAEDYEGDEDGFAWHERFDREARPKLVRAVIQELIRAGGWKVTPVSRGQSDADALELECERVG